MFARFFAVVFLAALAVATPLTLRDGQCNTGNVQCCESATTTSEYNASARRNGLAELPTTLSGYVGQSCTPLGIAALSSGASCRQQPMCCSNNQMNGVVNVGCTPINIGP
ncbi:hydrophobin [Suillus bovinus]|uniref:hydrophobin n=1 Tax=Suillus bovinus TaxID=48563 RepID=UPI001B881236|nr:hydrophobin [Suillus bovinus]KAG2153624.1 hydrophobin [Suillus bovinus]